MPFTGNTYTPPNGAENAAPGQVLQSAVWNSIFVDMALAFTTLMTQANTTPTWSNIMAPNGGFSIWQRGAGAGSSIAVPASTTAYTADRWYLTTGANQASVVSAQAGLTAAAPPAHAAKVLRNAAQAGVGVMTFGYPLSADEVYRMRGQIISLSAAAKAGTNWSPATGTFAIKVYFGTGPAGKRGGGFAGETNPLSITTNLAAGAVNLAISGTSGATVATNATQGEVQVTWTPVGAAGADDSITLDQFCLVNGAVVQAYEDLPFDICLYECKRFYRKSFPYAVAPAQNAGLSGSLGVVAAAAAPVCFYVQFEPVELYATASITTYCPSTVSAAWWDNDGSTTLTAVIDVGAPSPKGQLISSATAAAAARRIFIHYSADAGL